jgi:hypothetical protein
MPKIVADPGEPAFVPTPKAEPVAEAAAATASTEAAPATTAEAAPADATNDAPQGE